MFQHPYGGNVFMRTLVASLFVLVGLALVLGGGVQGGEKDKKDDKAVTLKGKITCAKCELGLEATCMTVIVVKQDKKDVTYYFDTDSGKKYHTEICKDSKQGSVVGVVSKKDDKNIVTVKKVTFDK
jgi:hypothetical protein